jgi:hypothetical protein
LSCGQRPVVGNISATCRSLCQTERSRTSLVPRRAVCVVAPSKAIVDVALFPSAEANPAHSLVYPRCCGNGRNHRSDSILSRIDESDFDELWLFGVDEGDGLSCEDCEAITRFRKAGRGLLVARDHMDLGVSFCALGGVGKANYFHSRNLDPVIARRVVADPYSKNISWPNYHSGANGDYQEVVPVGSIHPVLTSGRSTTGVIRYLPAHPHEGAVDAPLDEPARVIARGRSKVTGTPFNIAVAFETSDRGGRAIAQSTFHHFLDYNWDTQRGSPSFVNEPAGN